MYIYIWNLKLVRYPFSDTSLYTMGNIYIHMGISSWQFKVAIVGLVSDLFKA